MTIQDLRKLRYDHLKAQHQLEFYDYQEELSDDIIEALIDNLRITEESTPEQIQALVQHEIARELSRQSGKTYGVGHTCEFILTYLPTIFNRQIRIGIFAAQLDQAKISYNILRNGLRKAKSMMIITKEQQQSINEEENARKLVLPDGSSAVVAPISKVSMIEGLTLDLIIIDEAQLADDEIVKHSIFPMGKTTNAPRIYIGKAGTKLCHYRTLGLQPGAKKYYFDDIVAARRRLYEKTKNALHLIYEQSVKEDIDKYGIDSDEIQREYFGKWQIGTGQFVTLEALEAIESERSITHQYKEGFCYVGIDTAKHPDSTVVTVLRYNDIKKKKEVLSWLELRGENYKNQFEIIQDFLSKYKVVAVAIDSTGQGEFMPDWFEAETEWADENSGLYRVKFSQTSKDLMYKNLKVVIKESLTDLPTLSTKIGERFKQQLLDLQQEYKGELLSVKHPDDPNAHDDFPDSWALAEWAYAKYNEYHGESLTMVTVEEKERKVTRDTEGKVIEYWPGEDEDYD